MDADLLLRASDAPGILDGWVGPVVIANARNIGTGGCAAVVAGPHPAGGYWLVQDPSPGVRNHVADVSRWVVTGPSPDDRAFGIFLDLSRPECADRASRWLAGRVGLRAWWSTAPHWSGCSAWDVYGWLLDCRPWSRLFVPPESVDRRRNWNQTSPRIVVPALAALSPSDDACLHDGSRWVDRRALLLCAMHVGGSRG